MTSTATRPDLTHGALAAVIGPVSLLGVAVGLAKGERRSRGRCLLGLTTGVVAFLVPTIALFAVLASV